MKFKTNPYQVVSWDEGFKEGINISKKIENEYTKEICINISKGSFMKDHKAPFAITIQVLKGLIDFKVAKEQITLKELDSISLKANEMHNLFALENSIVRLTLYKHDTIKRVENVLKI
ncbi:cupin domain-containing protein [Campylobacter volucris]|uniref:cupin domain-containing protein n=1 Tax=Campylobacter volucris TaxID=1031542 RepID=UPI001E52F89E|nr:cupin domain-containing protein [Campylobacter volucris]